MATLQERAGVVTETSFQSRCLMARVLVAIKMLTAAEGEYSDQDIEYARVVFMRPMEFAERITVAVASQDSIADAEIQSTGSAPDADIEARVEAAWPYLQ